MSFFTLDWSTLSLQVMITFGHFLWQACVVATLFAMWEQAASIFSGRVQAVRFYEWNKRTSNEKTPDDSRRSAIIRYTLASLAFFALPVCVVATFVWVHQSRGPILLAAIDPMESHSFPIASTNEPMPPIANTDKPVLPPQEMSTNTELPITEPIESPSLAASVPSVTQRIQAYAPYLLLAYIIGVAFMLARFSLSIIGSSRLRRTIQPITDANLVKTIAEQCGATRAETNSPCCSLSSHFSARCSRNCEADDTVTTNAVMRARSESTCRDSKPRAGSYSTL